MKLILSVIALLLVLAFASVPAWSQQPQPPTAPPRPPAQTEVKAVFYCNATTKNGTPCKHRVKKQGDHCWQHKGAK